jgi:hypothetical protein
VKFHRSPQDPFGVNLRGLRALSLSHRDLSGARNEFLLTATVQNLRHLAKLAAIPPPRPTTA